MDEAWEEIQKNQSTMKQKEQKEIANLTSRGAGITLLGGVLAWLRYGRGKEKK